MSLSASVSGTCKTPEVSVCTGHSVVDTPVAGPSPKPITCRSIGHHRCGLDPVDCGPLDENQSSSLSLTRLHRKPDGISSRRVGPKPSCRRPVASVSGASDPYRDFVRVPIPQPRFTGTDRPVTTLIPSPDTGPPCPHLIEGKVIPGRESR